MGKQVAARLKNKFCLHRLLNSNGEAVFLECRYVLHIDKRCYICLVEVRIIRGRSSAGRAPALQAGGQEFESLRLHHQERLMKEKPCTLKTSYRD